MLAVAASRSLVLEKKTERDESVHLLLVIFGCVS